MDLNNEFTPATEGELSRFLAENSTGARRALRPVGGRTALHFGDLPETAETVISTAKLDEPVDHPARDMTVTIQAGMRMEKLAAMLSAEGQRLPVDIAQTQRATAGGCIAANASGPRRFGCGTLRDYLIGVTAVDASGRVFHAGGRVVKNVAGYDLCKMLVGSFGTLAVITQATFKLTPVPESSPLLWAAFDDFEEIDIVLERLLTSETRPVALEVLNADAARELAGESRHDLPSSTPVLCIGFEGSQRAAQWQLETAEAEIAPFAPREMVRVTSDSPNLWASLTEFQTYSDAPLTFQAHLLPSRTLDYLELATQFGIALQAHAGNGVVVGHFPDDVISAQQALPILQALRTAASEHGGNLVVLDCDSDWKQTISVFGAPEPSRPLMRQLKQTLDPHNLLNPGRLFPTATAREA